MDECYGAVVPSSWTGWDDKGVTPVRSDGSCHDRDWGAEYGGGLRRYNTMHGTSNTCLHIL